jgi:malonyl-CoA/methylmalonyl-CoA synthetase
MVESYLGILRLGAIVVLANPAYTVAELRHLLEDSGAIAAMAGAAERERISDAAGADGVSVLDVGDGDDGPEPVDVAPLDAEATAMLAYTSGTTGRPKAVPLTHTNVLSSLRSVLLAWRWREDDVLVHSLPLFHQHGLSGVQMALIGGSRAVLETRFDPATTCRNIESHGGTVLFGVPAMYERLAGHEGFRQERLGSLRLVVSGSAPLSAALSGRIAEAIGQIPLERYGLTESGLDVSNPYDGPRKPGSVGLPLPGVELALRSGDGARVADGDNGEITLRGPQVLVGYRGDDEATAAAFFPGGWFRTGDIGRIADDGYLEITGRLKELIISGGLNVYPREVQVALESSESVRAAAVVGVPSERWGEEVAAVVVPADGAAVDPDELIAFARERLAPYKCPKRVVVVDSLPTNHMGKVVMAEVRKLATA